MRSLLSATIIVSSIALQSSLVEAIYIDQSEYNKWRLNNDVDQRLNDYEQKINSTSPDSQLNPINFEQQILQNNVNDLSNKIDNLRQSIDQSANERDTLQINTRNREIWIRGMRAVLSQKNPCTSEIDERIDELMTESLNAKKELRLQYKGLAPHLRNQIMAAQETRYMETIETYLIIRDSRILECTSGSPLTTPETVPSCPTNSRPIKASEKTSYPAGIGCICLEGFSPDAATSTCMKNTLTKPTTDWNLPTFDRNDQQSKNCSQHGSLKGNICICDAGYVKKYANSYSTEIQCVEETPKKSALRGARRKAKQSSYKASS